MINCRLHLILVELEHAAGDQHSSRDLERHSTYEILELARVGVKC